VNLETLRVLANLADDDEFALRWRATPDGAPNKLIDYFVRRGIDRYDATYLAMAYIVGSAHACLHVDRSLARIAARFADRA
jgi:hypothetical protein